MKHLLMILCLVTAIAVGSTALAEGTFETLPDVGQGFFPGYATLSYDGTAMAGAWFNYFYWTEDGGVVDLDPDGLLQGTGRLSGDGMVMACTIDNADALNQAAVLHIGDAFSLMDLVPEAAPCDANISSGYDVTFDGTMGCGLAWLGCDARAFKWTEGVGSVNLLSSGNSSRGSGISGDGMVVVGFDEHPSFGNRRPALWTDDIVGPQLILGEEAFGECADASSDGSKVCGTAGVGDAIVSTMYYWDTDVGYVDCGHLPGDEFDGSQGLDISDDGKVVGYSGNPFFGVPRAAIWTPEDGLMELSEFLVANEVSGYNGEQLYNCVSISGDGNVIIGNYVTPDFFLGCFMVKLTDVVSNQNELENPTDTPRVATSLQGAYPNPFNPMTNVKFSVARDQQVRVSVIDMNGRRVAELASGVYGAGEHSIIWNGKDMSGRGVASGTYLVEMQTEEGVQTSKMMLVR